MSIPIAWVKFVKNVRRFTSFSSSGSGTSTSPPHMEMILKMGNLDFVGRDEVVALEWWKLSQVRRCAAELNEIVGDDLHLGHGNLAFQRPDAIAPDDNMTDVVGKRIDDDASNFAQFAIRPCGLSISASVACYFFLIGFGVLTDAFLSVERNATNAVHHFVFHQLFIFVRHLLLFVFLFETIGHTTLRIENFLANFVRRHKAADVIEFRTALLTAFPV